jgi:hypothetical protein
LAVAVRIYGINKYDDDDDDDDDEPQVLVRPEGLRKLKNLNGLIWIRNRDIRDCRLVL